jgi:hypothetical protein
MCNEYNKSLPVAELVEAPSFSLSHFLAFTLSFLLVLFSSCKKDNPLESTTPAINIESVSSTNIKEGDQLTFRISYSDGDGDLGENNPDATNLFLTDNRVNVTYKYRIKQLSPNGSTIIIKGFLNIDLNSTAITDASTSQSVTYSIYVKDRAGHQSNPVTSGAITIHK